MLLTLQFPIADLRAVLPDRAGRRELPDWPPTAEPRPAQFVRFFGGARPRVRGADDAWTDEKSFCRADQAIRLISLGANRFSRQRKINPACAFRRLLSDGGIVVRIEVGVSLPHPEEDYKLNVGVEELLRFAEAMLNLPSKARTWSGEFIENPLVLQGRRLAKLFAYATSYRNQFDFVKTARLVELGTPMLLIELDEDLEGSPPSFVKVEAGDVQGCGLAFGRLRTIGGRYPMWVLSPGKAGQDQVRSLRICLLRLHAEREALNIVLNGLDREWIAFEPGTSAGDKLEEYLNEATRVIYRERWSNISKSAILQAFDSADKVEYPANRDQLLRRYEGARQQVWRKVQLYEYERKASRNITNVHVEAGGIGVEYNSQTITNSHVGIAINKQEAERIEGSFNNFNGANPNDELKKAVAVLHEEVKNLVAKLPPNSPQREEVISNLETLTEQASKPKPLGNVLKVTGKGLIEAAQTVAEMVGPISTAVIGVLKIFGLAAALV
jgi:hypothetical protein